MKRPKHFTKKQSELLCLIYPGPVGQGISITNACVLLGISRQSGFARLKNIKNRFPVAWKQFVVAKKIGSKHRKQLDKGAEHGYSTEEKRNEYYDNFIEEKF